MPEKLKIWIDVDNSPHVPFFLPLIRQMEQAGHEVTITARDCFQTCGLLDMAGRSYTKLGRHYGKNSLMKVAGVLIRALQLYNFGRKTRFSVSASHGSRALILAAYLLGVPMVNFWDYEFSRFGPFLKDLPTKQLVPDVIPIEAFDGLKRTVRYPGLKEEVYLSDFRPDSSIIDQLGIGAASTIVTLRPPATEAHYHSPLSEAIFQNVVRYLEKHDGIAVVLLPRNQAQMQLFAHLTEDRRRKFIIPEKVVNGLNLIWHSDLVISGGGTMNREAAGLGVPVYSIFGGKIGAVDSFLAEQGKLRIIHEPADVEEIRIEKSHRHTDNYTPRQDLVDFLTDEILATAKQR